MAELDDKVIVTKDKITDIADTIRETGGTSARMTLDEMPDNIRAIGEGGGNVDAPLFIKNGNNYTCNLTFAKIEEIYAGTGDTKASMPQLIYRRDTRSIYCNVEQENEDAFSFDFNIGAIGITNTGYEEKHIVLIMESDNSIYFNREYTLEYQKPVVAGDGIELENVGAGTNRKTQISVADALMIIGESSGSVASFDDGGDNMPMKSCIVAIEPVQSGSGDPSPQNERPITGWTECNVTRDNKNLFDSELLLGAEGWQKDSNGDYYGSNSSMHQYTNNNDVFKFHKEGYAYTFTCKTRSETAGKKLVFGFVYTDGTSDYKNIDEVDTDWHDLTFSSNPAKTVKEFIISYNSTGVCHIKDAQMEIGTTATTYEPYKGQNYNIQFPSQAGVVYGGTLDVTNGVLIVDRAIIDMGDLTYTYYSANSYFKATVTGKAQGQTNIMSSAYSIDTSGVGSMANGTMKGETSSSDVIFKNTSYTDANTFATAMEGVQLVYELATPITYNLTPTEVKTLLGINNIFADCGDVDVEYVRDATSIINWLISQINLGA